MISHKREKNRIMNTTNEAYPLISRLMYVTFWLFCFAVFYLQMEKKE